MITHTDFDAGTERMEDFVLPSRITTIEVAHDGGRLSISIDGERVFYSMSGTRDCLILIDKSLKENDNGVNEAS